MANKEDLDDQTFEANQSGLAETYPVQCSSLRKNGYAMLKGKPCKIAEMTTSKTGKHGHAKVNLCGYDIFDNKKYEDMSPSTHTMNVPNVKRTEYTLIDILEDGYLSLMDDAGNVRDDLTCKDNPELHKELQKKFDDGDEMMVSILGAMGREMPTGWKPIASKT